MSAAKVVFKICASVIEDTLEGTSDEQFMRQCPKASKGEFVIDAVNDQRAARYVEKRMLVSYNFV